MINPNNFNRHSGRRRLLLALPVIMAVAAMARSARADGGSVLFQRANGPVSVTVFTSQSPVQVGLADLSVLVEAEGNPSPVLDAQVFVELEDQAGTILTAEATHGQARNKLLYCSLINIPDAGQWIIRVTVKHRGQTTVVAGALTAAPPQTKLAAYGKLLAFPPVIVILFLMNRWLRRERYSRAT